VFSIAKMPYDPSDEVRNGLPPYTLRSNGCYIRCKQVHDRIVHAIFRVLTGGDFINARSSWQVCALPITCTCVRVRNISLWQTIGFQRDTEFATDLRGVGMLGPLQMLWLVQHHAEVWVCHADM
jgi:hypothetical protein